MGAMFSPAFGIIVYRVQLTGCRKITSIVNYQKKKKSCTFILFYDISARQPGEWVRKKACNKIKDPNNVKGIKTGEAFHLKYLMKDELTHQVDLLLLEGKSRFQIWKRLKNNENADGLRHCLNNKALLKDRKAYRYLNILLTLTLLFVTTSKILGVVLFAKGLYIIILLLVPMINMYILKEVFCFKRSGYMFLVILSTLSLVYQENRHFPEVLFVLAMIAISSFLYFKLYPKKLLIPAPVEKPVDKPVGKKL